MENAMRLMVKRDRGYVSAALITNLSSRENVLQRVKAFGISG
jgi:hypothetical protein